MIYKHFATHRCTAFLVPPSCSSGWIRKHAIMSIFVVGHQRIILTRVLPIIWSCNLWSSESFNLTICLNWPSLFRGISVIFEIDVNRNLSIHRKYSVDLSNICRNQTGTHYSDVIMSTMASQITSVSIVQAEIKTSKLRVTGLCEGNSPVTSKNVSIWWRHHARTPSRILHLSL